MKKDVRQNCRVVYTFAVLLLRVVRPSATSRVCPSATLGLMYPASHTGLAKKRDHFTLGLVTLVYWPDQHQISTDQRRFSLDCLEFTS